MGGKKLLSNFFFRPFLFLKKAVIFRVFSLMDKIVRFTATYVGVRYFHSLIFFQKCSEIILH